VLTATAPQYREELERVFARRPVWSAAALRGTLAPQQHSALKALSLVAYTYTDGPWRRSCPRLPSPPLPRLRPCAPLRALHVPLRMPLRTPACAAA